MRDHPLVRKLSHERALGYDDAEALVRAAKDPASQQAVREIDAALAKARADALKLNRDMAARLRLTVEQVASLVAMLADDAKLETWLMRRVSLHRAHGTAPAHDEHPVNE